jgi:hypothetical protein
MGPGWSEGEMETRVPDEGGMRMPRRHAGRATTIAYLGVVGASQSSPRGASDKQGQCLSRSPSLPV